MSGSASVQNQVLSTSVPDPNSLVRGMDPDPDPFIILLKSVYHQAKIVRKTLIPSGL
jgi:hypothetical protein